MQKFNYTTHTAAWKTVKCNAKPGGVAADATADISVKIAALIADSNEDSVS